MRDSGLLLARRDLATEVRILPGLLLFDSRLESFPLVAAGPQGAYVKVPLAVMKPQ